MADIFQKRNSFSDDSRTTSTHTIVNEALEQDKEQNKDNEADSDRSEKRKCSLRLE